MGQYHLIANLDKQEYINPWNAPVNSGAKQWEQAMNLPSKLLMVLIAGATERRGGGDFCETPVLGRWAGDRIITVGDYCEDGDAGGLVDANLYGEIHEKWTCINDQFTDEDTEQFKF
jgi:hypothetical protein